MGTISVSLPSDGTTADVADFNTPINTIVNEINGELDNANIASDAAIDGSKLANASVTGVKMGQPVAFRATFSQSFNNVSQGIVSGYTESFDLGSNFASNKFTAPYDGIYQFNLVIQCTDLAVDSRILGWLYLDSTTSFATGFGVSRSSTHDPSANISTAIALTTGQTVEAQGYHDHGSTKTLSGNFSGFLIGRTD